MIFLQKTFHLEGDITLEIVENPAIPKDLSDKYPEFDLKNFQRDLLSLPLEEILPIFSFPAKSTEKDEFFKTRAGYLVYVPICISETSDLSLSKLEWEIDRLKYTLFTERLEEEFESSLKRRIRTLLAKVRQTMPPNCDISIRTIEKLSDYQIVNLIAVFAVSLSRQICVRICEDEESSEAKYLVERFCLDQNRIIIEKKSVGTSLESLILSYRRQNFDIVAIVEIAEPVKSLMENGYLQDVLVVSMPSSSNWERFVDSQIRIKENGKYVLGEEPGDVFEFDGVLICKDCKRMIIIENKRRMITSSREKTSDDRDDFLKFLGKIRLISQYMRIKITSIYFTSVDLSKSPIKKHEKANFMYIIDRNDWQRLFSIIKKI